MYLSDFISGGNYYITLGGRTAKTHILTFMYKKMNSREYTVEYPAKCVKGRVIRWHYQREVDYYERIYFYDESTGDLLYFTESEILYAEPYFPSRL